MGFTQTGSSLRPLTFNILGQQIRVDCPDPALRRILVANFAAITAPSDSAAPKLDYRVQISDSRSTIALIRAGRAVLVAGTPGDFLFLLEKDIIVELQRRRAELFFVHAAAVDWNGGCCLLAADSGSGKSTTTWGLLHHGFRYLGDELSPIDVDSMMVFSYPHALCLKQLPPPDYRLPEDAVNLGRTIHVPAQSLPGGFISGARPLRAVFLLDGRPGLESPGVRLIDTAEAGVRLYVAALNALAHENRGLDAAMEIAGRVPCFLVSVGELSATCALIRSTIQRLHEHAGDGWDGPRTRSASGATAIEATASARQG